MPNALFTSRLSSGMEGCFHLKKQTQPVVVYLVSEDRAVYLFLCESTPHLLAPF